MATLPFTPPLLSMAMAELVAEYDRQRRLVDRFDATGDDYAASDAADAAFAASSEVLTRLQSFVGDVPIHKVLEVL